MKCRFRKAVSDSKSFNSMVIYEIVSEGISMASGCMQTGKALANRD